MDITSFILGGSAAAILLVSAIKWIILKITKKETETLGALVILLVVSTIIAGGMYGYNLLSAEMQLTIATIYGLAIVIYDTLKKALWDRVLSKVVSKFVS